MAKQLIQMADFRFPYSLDAEQAVIGAMLQNTNILTRVGSVCKGGYFYLQAHRLIWDSIIRVLGSGGVVDSLTVMEDLKRQGQLELVGNASYLVELTRVVPSPENAYHYAKVVAEKYMLRRTVETALEMGRLASNEENEIESIIETAADNLSALAGEGGVVLNMDGLGEKEDWSYLMKPPPYRPIGIPGSGMFYGHNAQPGLFTLNGAGGAGKTWLALNAAHTHAVRDGRVLYLSTEMQFKRCKQRLASLALGIPFRYVAYPWDFNGAEPMRKIDHDAASRINEFCDTNWAHGYGQHFVFRNVSGRSLDSLRGLVHTVTQEKGPFNLVILDHVTGLDTQGAKEWEFQAVAARKLVEIAVRILECPIIVVQHPTTGEDRAKWVSATARGGNAWKNMAECCMALNFMEMHGDDKRLLDLECEKSRDGETGAIGLLMDIRTCRFSKADAGLAKSARQKNKNKAAADDVL